MNNSALLLQQFDFDIEILRVNRFQVNKLIDKESTVGNNQGSIPLMIRPEADSAPEKKGFQCIALRILSIYRGLPHGTSFVQLG